MRSFASGGRTFYLVATLLAAVALSLGAWDLWVERDGSESLLEQIVLPALLLGLMLALYLRTGSTARRSRPAPGGETHPGPSTPQLRAVAGAMIVTGLLVEIAGVVLLAMERSAVGAAGVMGTGLLLVMLGIIFLAQKRA